MKNIFCKKKKDRLQKALLLAEKSIHILYQYTENTPQPLSKAELEKIGHLVKVHHRNFVSTEYIHRHECLRADLIEEFTPINHRWQ